MAFAVFDEQNWTRGGDEGLMSVLACGDLGLSSGRYVWREQAAFLTTFTHSQGVSFNAGTAIPCFGDDEFLKSWNWIIHLSPQRKQKWHSWEKITNTAWTQGFLTYIFSPNDLITAVSFRLHDTMTVSEFQQITDIRIISLIQCDKWIIHSHLWGCIVLTNLKYHIKDFRCQTTFSSLD